MRRWNRLLFAIFWQHQNPTTPVVSRRQTGFFSFLVRNKANTTEGVFIPFDNARSRWVPQKVPFKFPQLRN